MRRFGLPFQLCLLALLAAFCLASVEWHRDHEASAQGPCQECCVQCCPSHHLAPVAAPSLLLSHPDAVDGRSPELPLPRLETHPRRVDRPPIA
ncbi:MAG: hypothetical protein IT573_01555 [Deltaproteobacteria bacterium]|nr:hypothetical protein [Deltaproteobacteria bacterium]